MARRESQQPIYLSAPDPLARPISALGRHLPHKLSEIHEVSDSSENTNPKTQTTLFVDGAGEMAELDRNHRILAPSHGQETTSSDVVNIGQSCMDRPGSLRSNFGSYAPSALSLPLHEIPKRKSSISALSQIFPESRRASLCDLQSEALRSSMVFPSKGRANSPVRYRLEKGVQSSEALRSSPSRTFVRTTTPFYLLDDEHARNPRFEMSIRLPSPLFVGGGTVEGQIELKVDATSSKKTKSKPLLVSTLSVNIIGVEEVEDGRRWIFLSLATDLFDSQHPPPSTLVTSQTPERGPELFWQTRCATVTIPFCLNLPLKLGPPPYSSRQASIRYLLCPSAIIKIGEKRSVIRQAWAIHMLTIFDPEKALASLPSPLLATDTLTLSYSPIVQSVSLTAGLHRQTWVSGGVVFVDVHVVNSTNNVLKRIDLQLEKSTLWFSHTSATSAEKSASNLRLPAKIDTEAVSKHVLKKNKEWSGTAPITSDFRTFEVEIPKGHATIGNGRFFEVRYFVKVTAIATRTKSVSVQLPISIIHINSLDIMPNALTQVAASIEAKRSMATTKQAARSMIQPHRQGQAFVAARRQSLKQMKHFTGSLASEEIRSLTQALDDSPRRVSNQDERRSIHATMAKENLKPDPPACHLHLTSRPSCYHCHLLYAEHLTKSSPNAGPKLPRLQVSTSGLGFTESEFEIPPDSPPRKVMLSERERQMINQQRELRVQRQVNQHRSQDTNQVRPDGNTGVMVSGWRNVAVPMKMGCEQSSLSRVRTQHAVRQPSQRRPSGLRARQGSFPTPMPNRSRSRSRTNPDRLRGNFSDDHPVGTRVDKPIRGVRSLDRDRYPRPDYNLVDNNVFSPISTHPVKEKDNHQQ